jgi:hypothetical protein
MKVPISNALSNSHDVHGLLNHEYQCIFADNLAKAQTTGTAMGTPPGCVYVTLYFGIWELEILPLFDACLPYYQRYINDCFGIWFTNPGPDIDSANWLAFQASMDAYGKLEWIFTDRATEAHFLDLSLTLTSAGINTSLYKK